MTHAQFARYGVYAKPNVREICGGNKERPAIALVTGDSTYSSIRTVLLALWTHTKLSAARGDGWKGNGRLGGTWPRVFLYIGRAVSLRRGIINTELSILNMYAPLCACVRLLVGYL